MKRIILCLSLFAFFYSQAQQINPVPDYVFSNKMSVGRNAVTDTAAYFSIGPRYGAIRGMMPPMVTDTASMSATKRNGLLIFSIQKNKYLYWDSVGSKWAEMAGTAGSAITGSGVAGYMPEFTTSTNLDTTRLYHSAGRFAIGSTTTTNGLFNVYGGQAYFDTSLKVGTQTLFADEGKNEVYVNTTTDAGAYALQVAGAIYNTTGAVLAASSGNVLIGSTSDPGQKLAVNGGIQLQGGGNSIIWGYDNANTRITGNNSGGVNSFLEMRTNGANRLRIQEDGEILLNNISDAGAYALQVAGSIYNTTGAVLAASSGNVSIGSGVAAPDKLYVKNDAASYTTISIDNQNSAAAGTGTQFALYDGGTLTSYFRRNRDGSATTDIGVSDALRFFTQTTTTPVQRMQLNAAGELLVGYTADQGTYIIQANGNALIAGNIRTAAPAGGTANDWRLGTVSTVTPTSPNRTIEVSIGGTIYYIHAKTTND